MIFDGPWDISGILTGPGLRAMMVCWGSLVFQRGPLDRPAHRSAGSRMLSPRVQRILLEAYKFIKFMSSAASQAAIAEANHTLPTRQSAYQGGVSSDPLHRRISFY